jgi:hypothetical protein
MSKRWCAVNCRRRAALEPGYPQARCDGSARGRSYTRQEQAHLRTLCRSRRRIIRIMGSASSICLPVSAVFATVLKRLAGNAFYQRME